MILSDRWPILVTGLDQPFPDVERERLNSDLDINHVFGTQARDGRRADVIDPERQRTQDLLEGSANTLELYRPGWFVVVNENHELIVAVIVDHEVLVHLTVAIRLATNRV